MFNLFSVIFFVLVCIVFSILNSFFLIATIRKHVVELENIDIHHKRVQSIKLNNYRGILIRLTGEIPLVFLSEILFELNRFFDQ